MSDYAFTCFPFAQESGQSVGLFRPPFAGNKKDIVSFGVYFGTHFYFLLRAFALESEGKKLLAHRAPVLPLPLSGEKLALCPCCSQLLFLFLLCVVLLTDIGTFHAYGEVSIA